MTPAQRQKLINTLVLKKVRVCQTMHQCELCPDTIRIGDAYFDGGIGRRAHVNCVRVDPKQEPITRNLKYTDAERLNKLEELLRSNDQIHEFWFDPDAEIFFAGDKPGDNLRMALDDLIVTVHCDDQNGPADTPMPNRPSPPQAG